MLHSAWLDMRTAQTVSTALEQGSTRVMERAPEGRVK